MEYLVEFEVNVPGGIPAPQVQDREDAEATAAARLADEGRLVRVWRRPVAAGEARVLGVYRADDRAQLDGRASTQIETAAPALDWLNKGVFVNVAGRQPGGVVYETYLVE